MNSHTHSPCVMKDTSHFYVKVCGCGTVHMCFGATTLNLSPEALIAVSETLKEISNSLRSRLPTVWTDPINADSATLDAGGNVIRGHFPPI